jgi:excisionase family DNA binding protein
MAIFLTVSEAAQRLRVSPQTIYGWVHVQKIPFRKHGGRLIFDSDDLDIWSKSTEVRPSCEVSSNSHQSRAIRSVRRKAGSLKSKYHDENATSKTEV